MASITVNEPGPYAFGSTITVTADPDELSGRYYPMVYVECTSVATGAVLWGQLAPPTEHFLIGDTDPRPGSWDQTREPASMNVTLFAYWPMGKKPNLTLAHAGPYPVG